MKKKILSIILSVVTIVSALSVGSMTAFAGGWVDTAYSVKLNTTYTESAETTDVKLGNYYYDAVKITIPANGKINLKITSENSYYTWNQFCIYTSVFIYKTSNVEDYLWCAEYNKVSSGYNSGGGYYYVNYGANLKKGTYYLVFKYNGYGENVYKNDSFDYRLSYTPSFSNTSISKVTPLKKSFKVNWKNCSNVSGYQIQYSTNKSMKNAKKVTVKGSKYYARTIKNLKGKKKYYVRVRTYKVVKVNGKNKTYYGKWSSKKAVTTKK